MGWRISCDEGKATEGLVNELYYDYKDNSFSNPSVALATSQLILQPSFRFSYVTSFSLNSPGEPPMDNTGDVVNNNSLSLNLHFSFLNQISLLLNQVATQLSSRGWVGPFQSLYFQNKFLGYSRG